MEPKRQDEVFLWAQETFGVVATNHDERAMRFIEEALELAQACGIDRDTIDRVVERVYEREEGPLYKELGQAGMTLEALAASHGINLSGAVDAEFERVQKIPKEKFQQRHAAKVAAGIAH